MPITIVGTSSAQAKSINNACPFADSTINYQANDLILVVVTYDTDSATTPDYSNSHTLGASVTLLATPTTYAPSSSVAGSSVRTTIACFKATSSDSIVSGDAIMVSVSVVAHAGAVIVLRGADVSAAPTIYGSSNSLSGNSSSAPADSAFVVWAGHEGNSTVAQTIAGTADAGDTVVTNGTTGGSAVTNAWVALRARILTTGGATQYTNGTVTDGESGYIIIAPLTGPVQHPVSGNAAIVSTAAGNTGKLSPASGITAAIVSASSGGAGLRYPVTGTAAAIVSASTGAANRGFPVSAPNVSIVSTTTGTAQTKLPVSGNSPIVAATSGAVQSKQGVSGTAPSTLTSSGAVRSKQGVSGTSPIVSSSSGTAELQPVNPFNVSGNTDIVSGSTGAVTKRTPVAGGAAAVSSSSGTVAVRTPVSGTNAAIASTAAGTVQSKLAVGGTAPIVSTTAGTVRARLPITAGTAATISASGMASGNPSIIPAIVPGASGLELEIYKYDDYSTPIGILPFRQAPTALEEIKAVGGGSLIVSRSDPKVLANPDLLKGRNMCKVLVNRVPVSAFLLGDKESVIVGQGERAEIAWKSAGPGLKQWFDDARVEPFGSIKQTSSDTRYFNFASEQGSWYNVASWVNPTVFSTVGSETHYPMPEKWPEGGKGASWIWGSAYSGTMPYGDVYFRYSITIATDGRYAIYTAVDDVFQLYVDGQQIAKSSEKSTSWREASRVEIDLTAGAHTIAYRAYNLNAPGYNGPAALAMAISRITGTDTESFVGQSQLSGWKVLPYPAAVPGWSPGEILNDLLNEASTRGVEFPTYLTRTFTDTLDSNGVPWPPSLYGEWAFKVGESLLSVINKLEEASVDIWIDPDNLNLNMVPTRGVDHTNFSVGSSLEVRRNFITNPLGSTAVNANGYVAQDSATVAFDTPTKGVRVTVTAGGGSTSGLSFAGAVSYTPGVQTYTVSMDVTGVVADSWRLSVQGSWIPIVTNGSYVSVGVGETKRLSVTFTSNTGAKGGIYLLRQTTATASQAIVKNVTFELGTADMGPLSGDMVGTPSAAFSWVGTANNSMSILSNREITSAPIEFKLGKHIREASTQSKAKIKNNLLLKTLEGWLETEDTTSVGVYGRLEATLDTNVPSELAEKIADIVFAQRAQEEEGASYDLIFEEYIPFVHFDVGDWVLAPNDQGASVPRRVMSIAVTEGAAGEVLYTIEFDTIFRDNEDRVNRVLDKLGGGGVGGAIANVSGSTPGVGAPIIIPPAATPITLQPKTPTGLGITSVGEWTPNGVTPTATATLTWNPVTQATDNTAMTPQYYEVQGWISGQTTYTDFGRVTTNTMELRNLVPGSLWIFQVRAVSPDGQISGWSTQASHTMASPNTPILAPEQPTITSNRGTVTVIWSGLMDDGNVPPPQFRYIYARVSSIGDTGPWTKMGSVLFRENRNIIITQLAVNVGYWIQLVAVDGLGVESAGSDVAYHVVQGITGPDLQVNSIDANVIVAGSIRTSHLSPEIGNEINLDGNVTITATQQQITDVQGNVDATQDSIEEMRMYYQFGPTGAVISKPGSVFSVQLDNDSIDMLENGNVVSYWNSGTLYVNQMVGQRVTLGNHQIEQYGTGTVVRAL